MLKMRNAAHAHHGYLIISHVCTHQESAAIKLLVAEEPTGKKWVMSQRYITVFTTCVNIRHQHRGVDLMNHPEVNV